MIWKNYWLWKGWAQSLYARHPEREPRVHRDLEALKLPKGVVDN